MSLHPDFIEAVRRLHPGVSFLSDVVVEDHGAGPFLAAWNLPGDPPTTEEIEDAMAMVIAPVKTVERVGIVRFTVASGVVSTTADTVGVSAVTRVSAGRYRVFYEIEDTDLAFMPDVGCIRDTAVISGRVTNRTASFVEVRTVNAAGTAADAAEIIITFDKVVTNGG